MKSFAFLLAVLFSAPAFAANYYDQFRFEVIGDCKDKATVWFRSTFAWDGTLIGKDNRGRDVKVQISIQLFDNGNYWASYSENAIVETTSEGTRFETSFEGEARGAFRVTGDQIELSGLGVGKKSSLSGNDTFTVVLNQRFSDPRAVGAELIVGRVISNTGPYGVSINDYCAKK